LEHHFFGATRDEALKIYAAHLKTDRFLKAAELVKNWRGIPLRNVAKWVRVG
jgi:hypothetical protein